MNNVVTVLYLLRALHRRIIVYCALSKIQNLDDAFRASLATAIYGNKMLDCLLSRSQLRQVSGEGTTPRHRSHKGRFW